MKKLFGLLVVFLLTSLTLASTLWAENESPVMVGRIYHIEGSLLRYVTGENDWVAAVRDAPFSTGDALYAGSNSQAELIIPNGTLMRVDDNTQTQFINLTSDVSEIDIASGLARFYNKDSDMVIKATSPFGYVLAYPGGIFDYYVGENSAEVVPIKGKITFVHGGTNARYEISPGNPSVLADYNQVTTGYGGVDPAWDNWNRARDNFWSTRARTTGRSAQYLPSALRHDAYVFDEYGRWDKVYYDGGDRWFWRPTRVPSGWAPFTEGRWTEWYGDQTWVPYEPFGYTTHHYGNWIFVRGRWYWAPPVARVTVGLPLLNIGFFWYPGRVSWIHRGSHVGWIPLAPREPYYSHHRWGGPHVVHVTNINITQVNVYPKNYAYARHAVVVPQRDFYTVNNYKTVRVKNINNTTIINNYQAAPVVNNTVIKDYATTKQKHNFTNVQVKEKPHKTVVERINENQKTIQRGKIEKAAVIEQNVKTIQEGKINKEVKIQQPKATNFIVPAQEVNRPKSEIKLQQREIRRAAKQAKEEEKELGKSSPKPEREAPKPERLESEKPGKKPAAKPEGIGTPEKPGRPAPKSEKFVPEKPVRPTQKPEGIAPERSDQPAPKPEKLKAVRQYPVEKRDEPVKPAPKSEEVTPLKPAQRPETVAPAKQAPKAERIAPDKPGRKAEVEEQEKPAPKRERVTPPKPQPKEKLEKLAPAKDEEQDRPNKKAVRGVPAKVTPQDKIKGEVEEQEKLK